MRIVQLRLFGVDCFDKYQVPVQHVKLEIQHAPSDRTNGRNRLLSSVRIGTPYYSGMLHVGQLLITEIQKAK